MELNEIPDTRPPINIVRKLLTDAFSEEELRSFCQARPLFQELQNRFSSLDGLDRLIRKTMELVDKEWLWKEFLLAVAEVKPHQFNRYAGELGWPQAPVKPTRPRELEEPPEPPPTYADVQIHVHPLQGTSYPVYIQTPMKADAQGTFVRPWSQDELLVKLTRLEKDEVDRDAMMEMGTQLYQALLGGFVQDRFKEARNRVEAIDQTGQGLRLRLWIEPPELQLWPWELLCDDERGAFLALSGRTLITRYQSVPRVVHPLAVQPPLRVLIAAAAPEDQPFLDVGGEIAAVQEALRPLEDQCLVQAQALPHAGTMSLREALHKQKPHILHYVGHGVIDRRGGALVLEKENGRSDALPGSTLGAILERNGVCLAVLNACVTAKGATSEKDVSGDERRAVLGVGPALLEAGLGAVVAMQFSLNDSSALIFATDLYQKLAELAPVDQAVSLAREALWLQVGEDARDWATPVLFMRVPDGRLFTHPG